MPWYGIFGLALLAAPRAVLHDLQVIEEGTALNAVLVFVPPVIWVVTALALNVRRPVLTLTAVGAAYGIILALVHLILWNVNLGPDVRLGGNLADLPPLAHAIILRGAQVISGLVTGVLVGAVTGVIAEGLLAAGRRLSRRLSRR
ncbi:MAG TPA: hypothetical protein VK095_00390 [Beutenbergiaceae bacterium]|nr:hypothetical protein [Beutenbergiaceae bacterium]